jgi:hypothetical protein
LLIMCSIILLLPAFWAQTTGEPVFDDEVFKLDTVLNDILTPLSELKFCFKGSIMF